MVRREAPFVISGKPYLLSERNKEDADFSAIQERVRKQKLMLIQDSVADSDDRLSMMMYEMRHIYNSQEIGQYIFGNKDEQLRLIYNSFKIKQPNIDFEAFQKLIPDDKIMEMVKIITEIEKGDHEDDKKKETPAQD